MRKILCPKCKKIISFEEEGAVMCVCCGAQFKISVFSSDEKNAESAADPESEIFYCGDEIIRVQINKTENNDSLKRDSDLQIQSEPQDDKNIRNTHESGDKREHSDNDTATVPEVLPAEVECEGEVIPLSELRRETKRELRRVKKTAKKYSKTKTYKIVAGLALTADVLFAATLYAPLYSVFVNGGVKTVTLAQTIGLLVGGVSASDGTASGLIAAQGALTMICALLCAALTVAALRFYGEYSKRSLKAVNLFGIPLGFSAAASAGVNIAYTVLYGNISLFNAALFSSAAIFAICCALFIMSLFFRREKTVAASPKIIRKKAYFTLSIACFFLWELIIAAVVSEGANIGFSVLRSSGADVELLSRLSEISGGIYGTLLSLVWLDGGISATNLVYSTYASVAAGICVFVYVIVYLFYICRTRDIFLGKVGYDGVKKFEDESYEERQLVKHLKKNTSVLFAAFAVVFTAEIARNVLLYMGGAETGAVIFVVIAAAGITCVRCFPYAQRAREIHFCAFEEFERMGGEQAAMTKKEKRIIEFVPLALVCAGYAMFVALKMLI